MRTYLKLRKLSPVYAQQKAPDINGVVAVTGNRQIRVDDNALPVTQKFLSEQASITIPQLSPEGVSEGAAAKYVYTLATVAARARQHFAEHRQSLSDDVKAVLGSLQDIIETDHQAAELLKRFLNDVHAIPANPPTNGGTAAGGADEGSAKEFG